KKVGAIVKDQPIFADTEVKTCGDVLALLVGTDEERLNELAKKVKVDFTPITPLTNPETSLLEHAPLIHPELGSNLIIHYPLRKGDIEKGFKDCDYIIEQTYNTGYQEHAYLEPECVIAIPGARGTDIEIIGSIQNPFTCRNVVAAVLGLQLTNVRIKQATLGGSFGGKDDTMNILSARAAIAALKLRRPIKIKYSREDSILESYKRHPYRMHYKVGYNKDGKIIAMKIDILADGGAYASMSPFVTWRSVVQATGPYIVPNVWTDVRAVYTNNPYTGAFRGFGSPQPIFAQEQIIDEIANNINISAYEIRKINGFYQNSETASGQILNTHDVNLIEILNYANNITNFESKWNAYKKQENIDFVLSNKKDNNNIILKPEEFIKPENEYRKGIGLSISYRGCSLGAEGIDAAAAYISIQKDGSTYLSCGLAENGQGMRTTFQIIAAEILGISPENIYYLDHDTVIIPDSGPTVASRSTLMGGGAVKNAATTLKERLCEYIIKTYDLATNKKIIFRNNKVIYDLENNKSIDFKELINSAYSSGLSLAALGWYKGPNVHWNEHDGTGSAYFTYVYGCQVAEVIVNTITGEVTVEKITAIHNCGKVINKIGAEGQVYGGVTQGAGYGLWEQLTDVSGYIKDLNYDSYLIPTSLEIGDIEVHFIEGKDPFGAWGAKSLGEPTLELTAASIANAVTCATGNRYFNSPLTIEEVKIKEKLSPNSLNRGSI
ncbi:MAG TPA: molybdopterin-dependent oxidoreductase, partial [Melioribacteraceae bacterium]|nr:molybdopterin-dependent oxidoreductase [Melioribacteraceae bacterium]